MQLPVALPPEVQDGLALVVSRLSEVRFNDNSSRKLSEAGMHLLKSGGKLVRPALVLLGSHVTNGINRKSLDAAIAVELIHTASLIHDDLLDKDTVRRGVPTVHTLYGDGIAILSGDLLISKAIELSASCGEAAISELSRAAIDMSHGEAMDYEAQLSGRPLTLEEYLAIARLKTASLIGSSAAIGAIVAGADTARVDTLRRYGENLGIAFQIRDDYYNALGQSPGKEKSTGNDERLHRPNIVTVLRGQDHISDVLSVAHRMNREYVEIAKGTVSGLGSSAAGLSVYAEYILI